MVVSQHAMCQPITGFGDDIILEYNAANTPCIEPAEAQNYREEGEGRGFSSSLA